MENDLTSCQKCTSSPQEKSNTHGGYDFGDQITYLPPPFKGKSRREKHSYRVMCPDRPSDLMKYRDGCTLWRVTVIKSLPLRGSDFLHDRKRGEVTTAFISDIHDDIWEGFSFPLTGVQSANCFPNKFPGSLQTGPHSLPSHEMRQENTHFVTRKEKTQR